ncbi:MAG: hypothetical protein K2G55_11265 [Lachnospiraceae bacterium]|nr:hypothetical protein [Lachnospiraceae bacterium]MDE7202048.1 hypothetical protein [Lachnospiraceae bacterium]
MKFKYMIRGLGLGVIITAAVMGAYTRNAVADARVAVLREYGFGEEKRLVGETETSDESLSEDVSAAEPTEQINMRDEEKESEINSVLDAAMEAEQSDRTEPGIEAGESSGGDAAETESSGVNASELSSAVVTPSDEGAAESGVVEIVISSGDDSGTVSRKLYNVGLIENASEFDAFLMQHGYDKRLTTGTKTIGVTDSWQEIADKITR